MKQLKILECIHETLGKMWIFELIDLKTKIILYKDMIPDESELLTYEEVNTTVQSILKLKGFLVG